MNTTPQAVFEPVVGRYLRLELLGKSHRLYVEEAGQGIPLLCLHTAGADTRQYRALLNDERILKEFRVIAFDLPWHGKSSPPQGWQDSDYALTSRDYMDIILGVVDALRLDRPVAMGCSIGGRIALHLALNHPERFRAIIGLESGAHVDPYYDLGWLHRPDVHGGEVCAAVVSGLIAPGSPDADRWETLWHYMQSGPGVFKGDLFFYTVDGDMRERLAAIDTGRCPLYLLTGEYDYSCTPEDTLDVARRVKGAEAVIMKELGHFPMSEHPQRFLDYLRPVLAHIRGKDANLKPE
jgi:pimeloyl-ACP methyl ester carboxylesterase